MTTPEANLSLLKYILKSEAVGFFFFKPQITSGNKVLISPQRSILAEKVFRDQLWPINRSYRNKQFLVQNKDSFWPLQIIQHPSTNQKKYTLSDHVTQI